MVLSLPILMFHSLDERPSAISFAPQIFRRGMARLHESGYRTLGLLDAMGYVRRAGSFPDRSFVITFDDGYQTVYEEAFPVLQRYSMSATVFLTVGKKQSAKPEGRLPSLGGRSMLTWCAIREMQRWGIVFGAHTLTHPDLTRLSLRRVRSEILDSKAIIEDALGSKVACFAYPYGRYDNRSLEIVRNYFTCACSDKLGLITKGSDVSALERVDAYYLHGNRLFDMVLSKVFPWYIRTRAIPRRIRRYLQSNSRSPKSVSLH